MAVAEKVPMPGGCVLSVMMLSEFEPGWLPGLDARFKPQVDVASFEDLWFAANEIIYSCMGNAHTLGWHEEGERLALFEYR